MAMSHHFSNFQDLNKIEPLLAQLGQLAERYVHDDPNTALLKLRQFGELLAQVVAAKTGNLDEADSQQSRLARLKREGVLPETVWQLLTEIRRSGNAANHAFTGEREEALELLQYSWIVGVWLLRTFDDPNYQRKEFVVPQKHDEVNELRVLLEQAENARILAEQRLKEQQDAAQQPAFQQDGLSRVKQAANSAAQQLDLTEAQTRQLIDAQLRAAGWEADSVKLRYDKNNGVRPEKGRCLAIAEWPTNTGPADYVLFLGLRPVAVIEAKRKNKAVMNALEQAARYSQGFKMDTPAGLQPTGGPWDKYQIPFLYATNGRPYLAQLKTESGIWFRDIRRTVNPSYPLRQWHTPQGLQAMLDQDIEAADQRLSTEPLDYEVGLRPYQKAAIQAVEQRLAAGQRELLLAMATGTGKTKTAVTMIYRLLLTGRFRRVLFLVDRENLGLQAGSEFKSTRLEGTRTFAESFNLTGLGEGPIDNATSVHINTVQGMVRSVLGEDPPAIDQYDLIVVDEAHRGYTLDRELSQDELGWRNETDYVSKYRQVLEHFDAVKIALTATPALHTTQIFGMPVFAYTYRDAVLDGVLIDHEAPTILETKLSQEGIHWAAGEQILTYVPGEDNTSLYSAPDDIGLEVEAFNRQVIARGFNQTVCEWLANNLDPFSQEKTLIFCVNDRHADEVVLLLRDALRNRFGDLDERTVVKITGSTDQPNEMIRHYRNEHVPNIAVTVDLLTTGVDVPAITNLVFLRRVRSRILFEQMLGRATRRCDDIGKTTFRIYDAVGAYAAAKDFNTMQSVVQNPSRTFVELLHEAEAAPNSAARVLLQQELVGKLQRVKRKLTKAAHDTIEGITGESTEAFINTLRSLPADELPAKLREYASVMEVLDTGKTAGGHPIFISEHPDEVVSVVQEYPGGQKAEDYLTAFERFVSENRDRIPALLTILTRPSELTRSSLLELKHALDQAGFREVLLQSAYARVKQVDAAASIIGFIRAAAEKETPQPFEARVDAALARILGTRNWNPSQKNWLTRLAAQLKVHGILDQDTLNQPSNPVKIQMGGFDGLNKRLFNGELDVILAQFEEAVWATGA